MRPPAVDQPAVEAPHDREAAVGDEEQAPRPLAGPARLAFAGGGVVCVGLGAVGAVVPGMPTTIFLIGASYLFARSFPALERVLLRNRLFARSMARIDGDTPFTPRERVGTALIIATSVSISLGLLHHAGALDALRLWLIVGLGLIGIVCVFRWRRDAASTT